MVYGLGLWRVFRDRVLSSFFLLWGFRVHVLKGLGLGFLKGIKVGGLAAWGTSGFGVLESRLRA